jgi:SAM-dependent methyltransferase
VSETPLVFDRALLARRRARAGGGAGFLVEAVAEDLRDRLGALRRRFALALDLGSGGRVTDLLAETGMADRTVRADPLARGPRAELVVDEEALPIAPASLDLVVATLSLQAVNDLPGALVQIRRALKPDGLFLAALAGGDTLFELRAALLDAELALTGGAGLRVAPFADVRALTGLLQRAGFALPVGDVDRLTVRYDGMLDLVADLKAMGATSALADRPRRPLRRDVLMRASEIYAERFSDPDGRVRATVDIVSLSGWAPHESQPKPARRGSGTVRLANALGGGRGAKG